MGPYKGRYVVARVRASSGWYFVMTAAGLAPPLSGVTRGRCGRLPTRPHAHGMSHDTKPGSLVRRTAVEDPPPFLAWQRSIPCAAAQMSVQTWIPTFYAKVSRGMP